ncbi:MAG: response regulator [Nitrospirota bacterium]
MIENRRCRLMFVDDEPIVGKRLKNIFDKAGYATEVFTNGSSALDDMNREDYDIIVTDLKMEGIDGMRILQEARRRNPHIKVIIITAYAEMETAKKAFQNGVFDFIPKPFKIDELKQVIHRAEKEMEESVSR